MNQLYYPISFQAQYEEISQKIVELSRNNLPRGNGGQDMVEELERVVDNILADIEQNDLLFFKEDIYSRFATPVQLNEKKKNISDLCQNCGEDIKKPVQCELCAEVYCKSCCWRKRVIPFQSNGWRLCCEVCHNKFIKLFHNKDFYEQKQRLVSVIKFVKARNDKLQQRKAERMKVLDEHKNRRRNDKMKENNLEKKIKEEEKKIKLVEEEVRRVVSLKAQEIAEREARKVEELQREKMLDEARKREAVVEELSLGLTNEAVLAREDQEIHHLPLQVSREPSKSSAFSEPQPSRPENHSEDIQNRSQKNSDVIADTLRTKLSSNRQSISSNENASNSFRGQPNEAIATEEPIERATSSPKQVLEKSKVNDEREKDIEVVLANMFFDHDSDKDKLREEKENDNYSVRSSLSRASKSILEMNTNELLGCKIPVSPVRITPEGERSLDTQQFRGSLGEQTPRNDQISENRRRSLMQYRVQQTPVVVEEQPVRMSKQAILRNSSLLSSRQAEAQSEMLTPKQCSCVIM